MAPRVYTPPHPPNSQWAIDLDRCFSDVRMDNIMLTITKHWGNSGSKQKKLPHHSSTGIVKSLVIGGGKGMATRDLQGWGCSSLGRVLTYHVQGPVSSSQNHAN